MRSWLAARYSGFVGLAMEAEASSYGRRISSPNTRVEARESGGAGRSCRGQRWKRRILFGGVDGRLPDALVELLSGEGDGNGEDILGPSYFVTARLTSANKLASAVN